MIYLDYNATCPIRLEAIRSMRMYYQALERGNASSVHKAGIYARDDLEQARADLADIIGAEPEEIVFTSGGTESNNMAIFGYMRANSPGKAIALSDIEHKSVLMPAAAWGTEDRARHPEGGQIRKISLTPKGFISANGLRKIAPDIMYAAVMHANNETGAIQKMQDIKKVCQEHGIDIHVDACQTLGKIEVNVQELGAATMSMSAHKIGGPIGVGALYTRNGIQLKPMILGGHQEADRRGGTENVAGIVGFISALLAAKNKHEEETETLWALHEQLQLGITRISDVVANYPARIENRLPNTLNYSFLGTDSEVVVTLLSERGIYVSTGSACEAGSLAESYVLMAMGKDKEIAGSAIRFSMGWKTREKDIDQAMEILPDVIEEARKVEAY